MKKKILVLFAIVFFSFSNIQAQELRSTVTAGAGFSLVGTVLKAVVYSANSNENTSASMKNSMYSSIPALQASYGFMLNKRFSVGAAFSHQYFNVDDNTSGEFVHVKRTNFAIRGLIHYGKSDKLDMYSGVRLGATHWNTKFKFAALDEDPTVEQFNDVIEKYLTGTRFAPQVILFGLRGYFVENVGAFVEVSVGPPAYLSAGLTFRI